MARNTQKQLRAAMKALMAKKNLDSITVQELSDAANVNKKTFYYHFQNMSDFLSWMYSAGLTSLMDAEGVTAENWPAHLKKVLAGIRRDHSSLTAIYASRYAPEFRQAISRMFDRAVEKYVKSSMERWETERISIPRSPVTSANISISETTSFATITARFWTLPRLPSEMTVCSGRMFPFTRLLIRSILPDAKPTSEPEHPSGSATGYGSEETP